MKASQIILVASLFISQMVGAQEVVENLNSSVEQINACSEIKLLRRQDEGSLTKSWTAFKSGLVGSGNCKIIESQGHSNLFFGVLLNEKQITKTTKNPYHALNQYIELVCANESICFQSEIKTNSSSEVEAEESKNEINESKLPNSETESISE